MKKKRYSKERIECALPQAEAGTGCVGAEPQMCYALARQWFIERLLAK